MFVFVCHACVCFSLCIISDWHPHLHMFLLSHNTTPVTQRVLMLPRVCTHVLLRACSLCAWHCRELVHLLLHLFMHQHLLL